jgi:hypothetical protein
MIFHSFYSESIGGLLLEFVSIDNYCSPLIFVRKKVEIHQIWRSTRKARLHQPEVIRENEPHVIVLVWLQMAAMFTKSSRVVAAAAAAAGTGILAYNLKEQPQHARNWHSSAHLKYPASANYPDLSKHNNHMADQLTPAVSSYQMKYFYQLRSSVLVTSGVCKGSYYCTI